MAMTTPPVAAVPTMLFCHLCMSYRFSASSPCRVQPWDLCTPVLAGAALATPAECLHSLPSHPGCPEEQKILGAPSCKSLQVKYTERIKVLRCSVAQRPHFMGERQNCSDTLDLPLVLRGELKPLEEVQSKMQEAPCTHVAGADGPVVIPVGFRACSKLLSW